MDGARAVGHAVQAGCDMRTTSVLLALLAACGSPETPVDHDLFASDTSLRILDPYPSTLHPTDAELHGPGGALTAAQWTSPGALEAAWPRLGTFTHGGQTFTDADAFLDHLRGLSRDDAELAVLALNIAMDDAKAFGLYAALGDAQLAAGPKRGQRARDVLAAADSASAKRFNEGYATSHQALYSLGLDDDQDGVLDEVDCDPADPTVGALLLDTSFDADDGTFSSPPPLADSPWGFDGSAYATGGGQQALLRDTPWPHVRVEAAVSSRGTQVGCDLDCAEVCGPYVPDDCYEAWDAYALGLLSATAVAFDTLRVTNTADLDICLDRPTMWDGAGSQSLTMGTRPPGDTSEIRLAPGESMDLYYGSYTTGVSGSHAGGDAWWCYQRGVFFHAGTVYDMLGAAVPDDLLALIEAETDLDGDSVEDHVDPASGNSVQTQQNIWAYQENHAMMVIGKSATASTGRIQVRLAIENRGAQASGLVHVEDTVPRDWELVDCDLPPTVADNGDGQTLSWDLTFDGCTADCSVFDREVITCDLTHRLPTDVDHLVLPEATAAWFDGDDDEVSRSLPAAAFDYDHDGDGQVLCGQTDRWRVGVTARTALDPDQDEGYHGYRCAVARNPDVGCNDPGWFLQVGEFMDAEEDDIFSECQGLDCPPNTTFANLARVDHTLLDADVANGDRVELQFWAVGSDLFCEMTTPTGVVQARAADASFPDGGVGLSTLNSFGDAEYLRVCEAYRTP